MASSFSSSAVERSCSSASAVSECSRAVFWARISESRRSFGRERNSSRSRSISAASRPASSSPAAGFAGDFLPASSFTLRATASSSARSTVKRASGGTSIGVCPDRNERSRSRVSRSGRTCCSSEVRSAFLALGAGGFPGFSVLPAAEGDAAGTAIQIARKAMDQNRSGERGTGSSFNLPIPGPRSCVRALRGCVARFPSFLAHFRGFRYGAPVRGPLGLPTSSPRPLRPRPPRNRRRPRSRSRCSAGPPSWRRPCR